MVVKKSCEIRNIKDAREQARDLIDDGWMEDFS